MTEQNLKDFLKTGAFLQIGPDLFKVFIGPFERLGTKDISHFKHTTLLYRPNFWDFLEQNTELSQKSVYASSQVFTINREEFIVFLSLSVATPPSIDWKAVNDTQFKTQFEWSQNNFTQSILTKTVPIVRQQGSALFMEPQLVWCLKKLLDHNNFGWSYGYFNEGSGYLGHTPEMLAQWTRADRQLHTVALAGTYAKTDTAFEEIVEDRKSVV